jgi:hypothetical protein
MLNLGNMRPRTTVKNVSYVSPADPKLVGEFDLCRATLSELANGQNVRFGQFGPYMRFAAVILVLSIPTFAASVLIVLTERAKKQMVGIHAGPIVAFVKNIQSFWDWTLVQFEAEAMGGDHASIGGKLPVSRIFLTSLPFPAFIGSTLIYLFPKAVHGWTPRIVTTNKANRLAFDVAEFGIRDFGYWGGLTTATFAKFGVHKRLHFSGDFYRSTRVSIAQYGGNGK